MGLLSTYVAYRLGKRSERRENAKRDARESFSPMDSRCVHYDYCSARGACLELTECEYE